MKKQTNKQLSPSDWEVVRTLFDKCISLSPCEREELLKSTNNPDVVEEIHSLLDAHDPLPVTKESNTASYPRSSLAPSGERQPLPIQLDRYVLLERVGIGGMAEVYLAQMQGPGGFQRNVAIKKILPEFSGDDTFRKLFEYESRLSSRLNHPNIVQIYDFVSIDDQYLLVMEYISGQNLKRLLRAIGKKKIPLSHPVAIFLIVEVCHALEYAHTRTDEQTGQPLHIVHRDVTPKNIMLSDDGMTKLLDFGIAKAKDRVQLTQTGCIRGTPKYLPPEVVQGAPATQSDDIYSTCVILYELIAGLDFEGNPNAPIDSIPFPSHTSEDPNCQRIIQIIHKGLDKERANRYPSALELKQDLEPLIESCSASDLRAGLVQLVKEAAPTQQLQPLLGYIPGRDTQYEIPTPRRSEKNPIASPSHGASPAKRTHTLSSLPSRSRLWGLALTFVFLLASWVTVSWFYPTRDGVNVHEQRLGDTRAPLSTTSIAQGCNVHIDTIPTGTTVIMNETIFGGTAPTTLSVPCGKQLRLLFDSPEHESSQLQFLPQEQSTRVFVTLKRKSKLLTYIPEMMRLTKESITNLVKSLSSVAGH